MDTVKAIALRSNGFQVGSEQYLLISVGIRWGRYL